MLCGDFAEDYEVMVPFQALQAFGIRVDAVCPGKKTGERIATAIHDFTHFQTYVETRGHDFVLNACFDDIDPTAYDALIVPGGRAAEYLRMQPRVVELVTKMFEQGKFISAICHGVQLLTGLKIVSGHRVTAYPAMKPEIEAAGGTWADQGLEGVCVDGKIITAPAWPAHPSFIRALVSALGISVQLPGKGE
jgi:protease I